MKVFFPSVKFWFSRGIFSRETVCNKTFARIISLILLINPEKTDEKCGWKTFSEKSFFFPKRTFFFPLLNFVDENVWNRVKIGFSEKDFLTKISCHFFPKDFFLSFFFSICENVKNFRRKKNVFHVRNQVIKKMLRYFVQLFKFQFKSSLILFPSVKTSKKKI